MVQSEPGISNAQQQEPPPLRQQSPDLNIRASQQPIAVEGKEATIHDFLSLCGSKSAFSTVAKNGLESSMTTQDLLQPLQKTIFPGSSNVLPAGFVLGGAIPQASSGDYNAGQQQTAYNPVNGGDHRSSDFSYVAKAHVPHGVSINKQWQQQQRHGVALEVLDGNKKLARVLSEDDDDEDDESFDHGYSSKKEASYQKFDSAQQLEGKNMDSKNLTPRSKHSATEQRRRSKINDRFQMLRQLLPNSNQKRDKASFLLEVIEHIQMLHEKVKKYEAVDYLGQLQERTKALPWDRTSGGKDGVTIVPYGSSVTTLTNDVKEATDATGYMRYRSSPLRVAHENGIANPDITSIRGHASSLPKRLLQAPACLPSYENSSLVSKPTLLSFTPPLSNSKDEPVTPTLFPSVSQAFPEARTMFAQLLHQEEQAAMRVEPSPYSKEEAMALPQLHQTGKSKVPQASSVLFDPDHERLRGSEQSPFLRRDRRLEEEVVEQVRSSPVKDTHQMTTSSNSRELDSGEGRTSHGVDRKCDGKLMHANLKRSKGDCRDEVLTVEQGPSAVLGGVVNISSPYSQGLLDTLTRALQSSGVDLAQARMSVQINLGKPGGSALTISKETATLNTAMLPVQIKENGSLQESEHPTKRLKVEVDP